MEINVGAARLLGEDVYFPGISYLVGQQRLFAEHFFVEYQGGVALPSIITAKVGLGVTGKRLALSGGLRVFPSYLYGQAHIRFTNGQLNFSFEGSPLEQFDMESLSFGTDRIFTCGYQWNIGTSRVKKGAAN
jgi:hypothetical protein